MSVGWGATGGKAHLRTASEAVRLKLAEVEKLSGRPDLVSAGREKPRSGLQDMASDR